VASFETVGSKEKAIAIIESSGNKQKDKDKAKEIIQNTRSIVSVLCKSSKRKGKLRKREYTLIAGNKNTEVNHKEYGFLIKVDPQKTYFSPRELTERQRIAKQVKKNEKVLVLFSGVGPFALAIKKKVPTSQVYGIELNKAAHKYAMENKKLNRVSDIQFLQGDVRKVIPKLKFDRILMPLPETAYTFLDIAFKKINKEGIIHYYTWGKKEEYRKIKEQIKEEAKKQKKKIRIIRIKGVLPYAPKVYKIAVDLKVLN